MERRGESYHAFPQQRLRLVDSHGQSTGDWEAFPLVAQVAALKKKRIRRLSKIECRRVRTEGGRETNGIDRKRDSHTSEYISKYI